MPEPTSRWPIRSTLYLGGRFDTAGCDGFAAGVAGCVAADGLASGVAAASCSPAAVTCAAVGICPAVFAAGEDCEEAGCSCDEAAAGAVCDGDEDDEEGAELLELLFWAAAGRHRAAASSVERLIVNTLVAGTSRAQRTGTSHLDGFDYPANSGSWELQSSAKRRISCEFVSVGIRIDARPRAWDSRFTPATARSHPGAQAPEAKQSCASGVEQL